MQDSAEYIIPMHALNSFLEVSTRHLQSSLPTLLTAWIEEVAALAVSKLKTKSKILDSASLVNECSSSIALLHTTSVSAREFTTFKARVSISHTNEDFQVYTSVGRVHNPFAAISWLIWNFLCKVRWLLSPTPVEYHIPSEHARAVYMRVLGEPWLLDVERVVLTSLTLAFKEVDCGGTGSSERGLIEGFAIRYSIAVALAALQQIAGKP
jgi:hypothetical protein